MRAFLRTLNNFTAVGQLQTESPDEQNSAAPLTSRINVSCGWYTFLRSWPTLLDSRVWTRAARLRGFMYWKNEVLSPLSEGSKILSEGIPTKQVLGLLWILLRKKTRNHGAYMFDLEIAGAMFTYSLVLLSWRSVVVVHMNLPKLHMFLD